MDALQRCCTVTDLQVPDEFENTHRMETWAVMKRSMEKQYTALLIPDVEKRQIQLVCEVNDVNVIKREIVSFIERECYAEECIPVERGQWEYMSEHSKEWNRESFQIENAGIQYKFPQAQDDVLTFRLKGETTPVRKHSAAIKAILGNIVKDKIEVDRPRTVKHFLSETGILELQGIGAMRKAVVEVSTLDEEKEEALLMEQVTQPSHRTVCSGVIAEDKKVEIMVGDLTEYPVDVIVNAANTNLQHGGGLAGLISSKGGAIIQQDSTRYVARHGPLDVGQAVLMKRVGNLRCKAVVHAVGPKWQKGRQNEEAYLARAVERSLSEAQEYTSIGLPAISSEIYGVPLDVCARAMFTGISTFFQKTPRCNIKVIIMLHKDGDADPFDVAADQFLQNVSRPERTASPASTTFKQDQVLGTVGGAVGGFFSAVASSFTGDVPFSQEHVPSRSYKHEVAGTWYPPGQGPLVRVHSYTESTVLVISVYAGSEQIVCDVVDHIRKIIDASCATEEVHDARVDDLPTTVEQNLQDFAKQLHVKLSIDRAPFNKIKIQGDKVDVSTIMGAIKDNLFELEMNEKRITQAELMTSTVQWQWKDSQGQFQNYEPMINLQIEEAHKAGNTRVVVTTDEGRKVIDLQNMTESSPQPPYTSTEVRRRDLEQERQDYEKEKLEGTYTTTCLLSRSKFFKTSIFDRELAHLGPTLIQPTIIALAQYVLN